MALYKFVCLIVLVFCDFTQLTAENCSKHGIFCVNSKQFRLCTYINDNGGMLVGSVMTCPNNWYCNADNSFPCSSTKPITTTTTAATPGEVKPPRCFGYAKKPGPVCNQYYECVRQYLLVYKAILKTCDVGLAFNPKTKNCESAEQLNCKV